MTESNAAENIVDGILDENTDANTDTNTDANTDANTDEANLITDCPTVGSLWKLMKAELMAYKEDPDEELTSDDIMGNSYILPGHLDNTSMIEAAKEMHAQAFKPADDRERALAFIHAVSMMNGALVNVREAISDATEKYTLRDLIYTEEYDAIKVAMSNTLIGALNVGAVAGVTEDSLPEPATNERDVDFSNQISRYNEATKTEHIRKLLRTAHNAACELEATTTRLSRMRMLADVIAGPVPGEDDETGELRAMLYYEAMQCFGVVWSSIVSVQIVINEAVAPQTFNHQLVALGAAIFAFSAEQGGACFCGECKANAETEAEAVMAAMMAQQAQA